MVDRRGVRSSSRRITPTPQPPSKAAAPQTGRANRRRGTRSASRDAEPPVEAAQATRRSARQASVTSVASESEQERASAPKTKRRRQKEAVGDLATVEELDTQIAIGDAPNTPPRPEPEAGIPHRSPGTVSEMSGTTAISSFSMVEAEMLEPRLLMRHLPKLYADVSEFLDHLVPDNGRIEDDDQHIKDMQKPDSDFSADYRDYNEGITVRLNRFRGEHQHYIRLRTIHRALFGPARDSATSTGLDLILYLANILVFAKQMIHSDRSDKEVWDALRELDNAFPTWFLPALILGIDPSESPAGESALLQETFELALDLRTSLAILWLERAANENNFNPDEALEEVFFQTEPSQEAETGYMIRGWSISALGGEHSVLPQAFQGKVVERLSKIREFFPTDDDSLERGESIDLESLDANFPWSSVILRLLNWVRLRNRELQAAIQSQGGIDAVVERVKTDMEQAAAGGARAASVPRASPRKKRTSFGRGRRRSGRKFDPNAELDDQVLDKLIARERGSGIQLQAEAEASEQAPQIEEEVQIDAIDSLNGQEDWQTPPEVDEDQAVVEPAEMPSEEAAGPSKPPQSTAELLKVLRKGKKLDKENLGVSLFERQATARRVDFGDGFGEASQAAPGPSNKGKQREEPSPGKRRRPFLDSSDDEDAFEHQGRATKVQERRVKAANAKRVRIDPGSSGAPTSHQPPARPASPLLEPAEQEESPSETEAPEMTEPAPSSSYAMQKQLSRVNAQAIARTKPRRGRVGWTTEEEDALIEYMGIHPQKYSQILALDGSDGGYGVLQDRDQVQLKDKARNMAINMIKSGAGLRTGFENIIRPNTKQGEKLIEDGFTW